MAKKKSVRKKQSTRTAPAKKAAERKQGVKKKSVKKKAVKKKAVKKKTAAKKKAKATGQSALKKSAAKKKTSTKPAAAKKTAGKKRSTAKSLGRPRIAGDAKLDVVFQKDYSARNAFQFLGVTTLRELEELRADEIVERLTRPAVETVQRIRKSLALLNRSLNGDRAFALKFRADLEAGR